MTRKEIRQKTINEKGKHASDYGFNTDWCALFVNYIFDNIFKGTPAEYSCTAQRSYWKENKSYYKNITGDIGDIIYYDFDLSDDFVEHTGIITDVNYANKTYTVTEGNYGASHWTNTKVGIRTIPFSYTYIDGIAKPRYENDLHLYGKSKNCISISPRIATIQHMLNAITTNENAIECDGIYGDKTENRVEEFQTEYDLEVDGIVGNETITMLTKLYFNI